MKLRCGGALTPPVELVALVAARLPRAGVVSRRPPGSTIRCGSGPRARLPQPAARPAGLPREATRAAGRGARRRGAEDAAAATGSAPTRSRPRERLFTGYGSCSWREPVDDLRELGVLDDARLRRARGRRGVRARRRARARPQRARRGVRAASLNAFMARGPGSGAEARERVDEGRAVEAAGLGMPFEVADYVDFYSSLHHATNLGRMFRPDARAAASELAPPAGGLPRARGHGGAERHARAATVRPAAAGRRFGPSVRLDIELEAGFVVGTPSRCGEPVPVERALDHVFGMVLVNDWSARDIQAWEYQPLGPSSASRSPPRSRLGRAAGGAGEPAACAAAPRSPSRCPTCARSRGRTTSHSRSS